MDNQIFNSQSMTSLLLAFGVKRKMAASEECAAKSNKLKSILSSFMIDKAIQEQKTIT